MARSCLSSTPTYKGSFFRDILAKSSVFLVCVAENNIVCLLSREIKKKIVHVSYVYTFKCVIKGKHSYVHVYVTGKDHTKIDTLKMAERKILFYSKKFQSTVSLKPDSHTDKFIPIRLLAKGRYSKKHKCFLKPSATETLLTFINVSSVFAEN